MPIQWRPQIQHPCWAPNKRVQVWNRLLWQGSPNNYFASLKPQQVTWQIKVPGAQQVKPMLPWKATTYHFNLYKWIAITLWFTLYQVQELKGHWSKLSPFPPLLLQIKSNRWEPLSFFKMQQTSFWEPLQLLEPFIKYTCSKIYTGVLGIGCHSYSFS